MAEIQLPTAKCERSNYVWNIRVQKPRRCPRCKSPYWNVPRGTAKRGRKLKKSP